MYRVWQSSISQNCVYQSDENANLILEKVLHQPGVIVWAGVNQMGIIWPDFLETNVNGEFYIEFLLELRP